MILEFAQTLLFAATLLVSVAFAGYLLSIFVAGKSRAKAKVSVASAKHFEDGVLGANEITKTAEKPRRSVAWWANKLVLVAAILVTCSMVARWIGTGKPPMASHYEFAVMFCWGMLVFQLIFEWRYKARTLSVLVLPVILGMLIYSTSLSYEANPLMPALQNSPMLTLHVFTAALSYGAAVVSFGAGVMYLLSPYIKWRGWPKSEILDDLGYRAVVITYPLLTISIILGSLWANVAWGRYWSWDPKETAALVTWFIYGAYLHARVVRGMRGKKAAWLLVLGFLAIIFTYFGNLWFGGLHSYV